MFGSIFSFAGDLIGGALGARSANRAQDATANQAAADREMQREFAQNGIRWRVEDAKAAGIHPLAALGAPSTSYTPVGASFAPDNSLGDALSNMGQDISRSINATRTQDERTEALHDLTVEKAELENEFLRTQINSSKLATIRQAGGNPPMPSMVNPQPHEPVVHPHGSEPGSIADVGWSRRDTPRGPIYYPLASKDAADRMDIEGGVFPNIASISHMWRNQIVPNAPHNWLNQDIAPPKEMLPKGATRWMWDMSEQGWRPISR